MVKVKNKKRNLAEFTSKKRNQQQKKTLNAFEVHINKEKHKVLGRKNKADYGLPGVSRAKAIQKRKNTLLHEYKVRDKSNTFMDRRIGERNSAMTQEDRVMARFAAERMKAHRKKNIFNLNDDEMLTHRGQTLAEIEKFDDPRSDDEDYSDEENKTGKLDKDFVGEAHFGGGVLSKSSSSLSRKDLIDQLIAESKKRKAEKQKVREQTLDLTEKLDSEWKDLLPIVSNSKKRADDPVVKAEADDYDIALRQLKFEARGKPSDKLKSEEEIAKEEKEKLEKLEADRLERMRGNLVKPSYEVKHKSADDLEDGFFIEDVNEETLVYGEDGRVKTTNKNKNESSSEAEESNGESETHENDDQSMEEDEKPAKNDDSIDGEGDDEIKSTTQTKSNDPYDNIPVLKISDNTDIEKAKRTVTNKNSKNTSNPINQTNAETTRSIAKIDSPKPSNESQHDSLDENSDAESDLVSDQNSDDDSADEDNLSDLKESDTSSEDDEPPSKKSVQFSTKLEKNPVLSKHTILETTKSILKVDRVPSNDEPKISAEERSMQIKADLLKRKEVMEKARQELPYTYEAPESLEELEKLLQHQSADYQSVIIERIIKCNHASLGESNKEKLSSLFQYLLEYLMKQAADDEADHVNCFQIFDRLCPHFYDLAHMNPMNAKICIQEVLEDAHEKFESKKKVYPGITILMIFKLISLLFPTSDFRHPVVTPALVFMSQILLRCRVRNRTAISRGLFICTLILEYTLLSKRFTPSAINFLRGVIHMATPIPHVRILKTIPPFKSTGESSNLLTLSTDQSDSKLDLNIQLMTATDLITEEIDDNFRIRAFITACNLVSEFKSQLEELEAAHAIIEPIIKLLSMNELNNYPKNVKEHVTNILVDLRSLENKKLEYLVREKKKPKVLRLYEPRIETVYDGKRYRPMSKEKAETEKLLHKYKKEFKGAIREIRRDRSFLAKVQIKQQIKSDEERKRKVKEIFGNAALQQGELNKIKRSK